MKIKKDAVYWGYISTAIYSGINIILLPIILHKLPNEELGLWYTFSAIAGFTSLLNFGFSNTILRNVAYSWSGIKIIEKEGINNEKASGKPNIYLFKNVFDISRLIYLIIAIIALIALVTIGNIYIISVCREVLEFNNYFYPWVIYAGAIVLDIMYSYWTPVLKGIGAVKSEYQAQTISKILQVLIVYIMLLFGLRLYAVAIGYFVSSVGKRLISRYMFYKYQGISDYLVEIKKCKSSLSQLKILFSSIWPNTYKQGLTSLAKYATDKFVILLCTAAFGLTMSGQLGLSIQVYDLIASVGAVCGNSYMPLFSNLHINRKMNESYKYFTTAIGILNVINFSGGIFIALFGNLILNILASQSSLLPLNYLIILFIFNFLHHNQNMCIAYIVSSNRMPMYKASIISAVFVIILQYIGIKLFADIYGLYVLLLPMLIVELLYNAWKWPKYVIDEFSTTFWTFYRDSFYNLKYLFLR